MLWQRVLTAGLLLPPAVAAIWFLSGPPLGLVFAGVGALAAWEWAGLSGIVSKPARVLYALLVTAVELILLAATGFLGLDLSDVCDRSCGDVFLRLLLFADAIWWTTALAWIFRYPTGFSARRPSPALRAVLGALVVPATIVGLLAVRGAHFGRAGLLTLFALVWAADIAAYFAGRALGRHKLAPQVSPGKTWEGFCGGVAGSLLVGLVAGALLLPEPRAWSGWLTLCALVCVVSVVGDLTESLLKRLVGVKDSGSLLPGHGGVLDRIDSLLAAAPVMALGLTLLGL